MPIYFEEHETTLTRATKVASVVLGVFFLVYGGIAGLAGADPEGALGFPVRLLGVLVFLVGMIFILPNRALDRVKWIFYASVALVFASSAIMLFLMFLDDVSMVAGYAVYGMIVLLSAAAITSFYGYKQGREVSDR